MLLSMLKCTRQAGPSCRTMCHQMLILMRLRTPGLAGTVYCGGWRDGSEVKYTDHSSEGPEFESQQQLVAHNHP